MLTVIVYLLSILLFLAADKDPLEFDFDTCVKIFYSAKNEYKIYCLNLLDEEGTMGIVTDHNHTIIFKKTSDMEDESKICINVLTEHNIEKHCYDAISHNCISENEDATKYFMKTRENVHEHVQCNKVNLEEIQLSCMGVKHQDFTLIAYCRPLGYSLRRTVLYIPNNKPPKRERSLPNNERVSKIKL